jgi:hypothetical protein
VYYFWKILKSYIISGNKEKNVLFKKIASACATVIINYCTIGAELIFKKCLAASEKMLAGSKDVHEVQ